MLFRLALKEIWSNRKFSSAFCLNMGLGLFGFVLLSAFHSSIEGTFRNRSKALLTADLSVSARRPFTEEELKLLRATMDREAPGAQETRSVEMYSMMTVTERVGAKSNETSRLVEVVGIEDGFPLYGEIKLEDGSVIASTTSKAVIVAPDSWIAPELSVQMGLLPGDSFKLGDLKFLVAAVIKEDASNGWRGFAFAPRMYAGMRWLEKTGLMRKGSTVTHSYFYKVSEKIGVKGLADDLNTVLTDPGIRVTTHEGAGEQMTRTISYLADYLGLVSLVGIFLAALGSAYLFQSFLSRRLREIATLISLGVSHTQAILVYLVQSLLLGLLSASFAVAAALLFLPAANARIERALDASLKIDAGFLELLPTLLTAIGGGIAVSILICLPLAIQIRKLKPATLFQESAHPSLEWSRESIIATIPVTLFAYLLSVWQAHSWKTGGLFFAGLVVSSLLLSGIAVLLLRAIGRFKFSGSPFVRLSFRYLSRNRISTVSAFLAIGLGSLLINLLPQLQQSIESEISAPEVSSVPSLFLFDIQEEQAAPLSQLLEREKAGVMQMSPLVRARLETINGKPFEKPVKLDQANTREEEQEARSRNRGFNLTFREKLTESETLIEGRDFKGRFEDTDPQAVPEVSVEYRFAERLGLKLGDLLQFSVESVPVEGRIVNLRKVRWTSFQPNFFVTFQPGVLDDAPKTYLASVQKLGLRERSAIQSKIVRAFSNVSIIDVTALVQKMLDNFEQMSFALRLMALLAVVAGLVVVFSIANHQARSRQAEIQLLKVLGTERRQVAQIFLIEFGLIGLLSACLGVLISTVLGFVIAHELFDRAWSFSIVLPLATVLGVTLLTVITTQVAAFRNLRQKPASLLGGES